MDILEIVEMFSAYGIPATKEEIFQLFFKGQTFPEKGPLPNLDFYSFMMFCLSKDGDANFRDFIRKITKKIERERKKEMEEYRKANEGKELNREILYDIFRTESNDNRLSHDKENKIKYLPCSFSKLINYFALQGKQRDNFEFINEKIVNIILMQLEKYGGIY